MSLQTDAWKTATHLQIRHPRGLCPGLHGLPTLIGPILLGVLRRTTHLHCHQLILTGMSQERKSLLFVQYFNWGQIIQPVKDAHFQS